MWTAAEREETQTARAGEQARGAWAQEWKERGRVFRRRAERERWNACSVVECGHNAARRVRALKKVSTAEFTFEISAQSAGLVVTDAGIVPRAPLLNHVTRRSFYSRSATPLIPSRALSREIKEINMILAILVTMLGAASAQTGITVQFYTDTSCSTIQAGGYAAADTCITAASMGHNSALSFKGSCAALTDTVMKYPRSGATRTGLEFEMYSSGDCTGGAFGPGATQAPSSRTDLDWTVPTCQTCETSSGWRAPAVSPRP